MGVNLYFMHIKNAAQWYQVESEQLGRSLTAQAAKLVAAPLAQQDQDLLAHYVTVVNQGMFVKGAVLFNENGERFANQEERLSVVDMLKQDNIEPLVFVEDIIFDGNTIGYIKLVLDKQAITKHHRAFNQNQISQTLLTIMLCMIAAVLVTRMVYKLRNNYKLMRDV